MPDDRPTSDDDRIRVAAAVLAGRDLADVARETGFEAPLVERWATLLRDAGTAAIGGAGPADPAARDRFLALISHELRTPLTVVSGWIDTLRALPVESLDAAVLEPALTAMASHTERLARLADDLLDSAAVSLGRLRLESADVDLAEVARESVSSFPSERIRLDADDPLPMRGDRIRLGQVLANLVSDALGRTSSPIAIRVGRHDLEGWHAVEVTVPGTPPPFEEMLALFEPFDQGTGGAHVGLGLYVCRALAVAHGGQCGVDADDDSLTFWVRLPVGGPVAAAGPGPRRAG